MNNNHSHDKSWSCTAYISSLIWIFPFSNLIIPLLIYIWFSSKSDLISYHTKNILNFQINMLVVIFIVIPITWLISVFGVSKYQVTVLSLITMNLWLISSLIIGIYTIYQTIKSAIKCHKNEQYKLPSKIVLFK